MTPVIVAETKVVQSKTGLLQKSFSSNRSKEVGVVFNICIKYQGARIHHKIRFACWRKLDDTPSNKKV